MHDGRFIHSPWFLMLAGGGLLSASMVMFAAGAKLLGWIVLTLSFPFAFETAAWEDSAAHAAATYDVDWSTVHREAYSAEGAPARFALLWGVLFVVLFFRESGWFGEGLPLALLFISIIAWTAMAWLAHRRAVKAWAKARGLRSRWAKE